MAENIQQLIAHKQAQNLCSVNSFPAERATTEESPPENCRHFIHTHNTSGVTSGSRNSGINSFMCGVYTVTNEKHMIFISLLVLVVALKVCKRHGGDREKLQMFNRQLEQQLNSVIYSRTKGCWVTCGHLDTVWKKYKVRPQTACVVFLITQDGIWMTCEFTLNE